MFPQATRCGTPKPRRQFKLFAFVGILLILLLAACQSQDAAPAAPAPTDAPAAVATEAPTEPVATTEDAEATAVPAAEATQEVASTGGAVAFLRGGILYIQNGPTEADLLMVEDCSAGNCFVYHLDWSPKGDQLLYYIGSYDNSVPHQIRLASATGALQAVTEQASYIQPAGWSWDGTAIVYRTDTDRYANNNDGPGQRIQELWTVTIAADGTLGEPELRGEITFGEGCGGGGRSESANAYEREGGFAYGYLSGIMAWTPENILLYTDACTTRGVSRFDLTNNVPLEKYDGDLRSLSLNAAGDAWVAINADNQIVMGTPGSLEMTVVPSSAAPELVAFGKVSGTIYYTTLEIIGAADLVEQASATLDPSVMIFPYFDTTEATLIALNPATGEETTLVANDGYAYARILEAADGSVIFSRVEDNAELQAAVENEEITAENWRDYLPTVDVLTIPRDGSGGATLLLADAAQFTPAQ